MSGLDDVGARDGWRCWICDEPVDPDTSVNDARGPSVDSYFTASKAAKGRPGVERLAHRACNTKKGATTPVIRWPDRFFVSDPAVLLTTVDRLSRLAPGLPVKASVEPGGGQQLLVLTVARR